MEETSLPVLETSDRAFRLFGLLVLLVTVVILGGWAALAPLDSAVIAQGMVEVAQFKQKVQHQQGGVVRGILVKDGDLVQAGEPLLVLDQVQVRAQIEAQEPNYGELLAQEQRLIAERDSLPRVEYGPELQELQPTLVASLIAGQDQLFMARRQERLSQREVLEKRIAQYASQIVSVRAAMEGKSWRLAYVEEEVGDWEILFDQQLTDKLKLRELQKEQATLRSDLEVGRAEIDRLESAIAQTGAEMLLKEREFEREVATSLRTVQAKLAEIRAQLVAQRDTLSKSVLQAPATGYVVGLAAHTLGGVIGPGETVLEIVPRDQRLMVKTRFASVDIDRVRLGQAAEVIFSSYSFQVPHMVAGALTHVSAHSFVEERSGGTYYEAWVDISDPGMEQIREAGIVMVPGMPAEVHIVEGGRRTMLNYLARPLARAFQRAFREK